MATEQSPTNPPETPFEVEHRVEDGATVIALTGSCSMTCADRLGSLLMQQAESEVQLVVLDLSRLEFIESTSLGKTVAAYLKLRRRGADMRLVGPNAEIRNLLKLTRLDHLFTVADSVKAAIEQK